MKMFGDPNRYCSQLAVVPFLVGNDGPEWERLSVGVNARDSYNERKTTKAKTWFSNNK